MTSDFEKELSELINRYSKENDSNTPDCVLARYLQGCLDNFTSAIWRREAFHGRVETNDQ